MQITAWLQCEGRNGTIWCWRTHVAYYFEFDGPNRVLQATFTGQVTDEEVTTFYRMATEYVALLDPIAAVVDFSDVTSFEVRVQTIRQLAKSAPAMPEQSHPRVIVAASPHIFGMARMFEFEGESTRPNLHVVRTMEEAWAIIGIHEFKFEPIAAALNSSNVDSSC